MNRIYGKVCNALEEDGTLLSKLTLKTLLSEEYNIYTIEEEDGIFHYTFNETGKILPEILYDYLGAFIEKKLGYKFVLSGTGIRPVYDMLKKVIR